MSESDSTAADASTETADGDAVLDRRLPSEIADNLRSLFGTDDRPETLGEWTDAVAAAFGDDWPPALADLCHDDEGRHRAEVEAATGTETYRFVCVLDAFMLPFLPEVRGDGDRTVAVRSEGPETGETVASRVTRERIETDPADAVLSFGVAETDPDAAVTPEATYGALCPYVHAFPDGDAYRRWAERTDAPTTALPLSDGLALVRALVRA
ncbi:MULTISPECIES: organomercurial lyase [Halorussus]|uniref:organomercurial lyase n=1 Tax=Halorussus TaxID=1070314 RepID=UPI000E20CB82|nr:MULTISPECIES: organomercurial lyase [Halorussus]NHN60490.1 alkylmercury lyase [Halorussus sp. JP-T4]